VVVTYADDTGTRIAVAAGALVILAGAIWYSKRQKAEELVAADQPPTPEAATVTTEAG
jgi:LPXTG-motif cell wall-anchored protein